MHACTWNHRTYVHTYAIHTRVFVQRSARCLSSSRRLFRSIDLASVTAVTRFEIPRSFTTRRGVSLTIARRRLISQGSRLRARCIAQQAPQRNCDCNDPCPRTVKGRPKRIASSSSSQAAARLVLAFLPPWNGYLFPSLPYLVLLLVDSLGSRDRTGQPFCYALVRSLVASPDRHARGESANYDDWNSIPRAADRLIRRSRCTRDTATTMPLFVHTWTCSCLLSLSFSVSLSLSLSLHRHVLHLMQLRVQT